MFPYYHLVWAKKLRKRLGSKSAAMFNLGSVTPDVRYVDGIPWEATHFPMEEFWAAAQRHPGDRDFALGYLLHLSIDEWEPWFIRQARQRYPLGKLIPRRIFKVLLEAASAELYPLQSVAISKKVPELALSLGISAETIRKLRDMADELLRNPDLDTAIHFVQKTQLTKIPAIRILMWLAVAVLKTPLRGVVMEPAKRTLQEMERLLEPRVLADIQEVVGELPVPGEEDLVTEEAPGALVPTFRTLART